MPTAFSAVFLHPRRRHTRRVALQMPVHPPPTPPSHEMTALTPFSGIFLRPRAAGGTRADPSSEGYEGEGPLHPQTHSRRRPWANFGELLLPFCDNAMLTLFSQIFSQTRTAGGARGVPRRDKRRWRLPSPCTSRPRRTAGGIARYVLLLYPNPPRRLVQETADPRFPGAFREPPTAGGMHARPRRRTREGWGTPYPLVGSR